jgi:hypothetical protein
MMGNPACNDGHPCLLTDCKIICGMEILKITAILNQAQACHPFIRMDGWFDGPILPANPDRASNVSNSCENQIHPARKKYGDMMRGL